MALLKQQAPLAYTIAAGKMENAEVNWKYIDHAATLDEALAKYLVWAWDYPIRELKFCVADGMYVELFPTLDTTDGTHTRVLRNKIIKQKEDLDRIKITRERRIMLLKFLTAAAEDTGTEDLVEIARQFGCEYNVSCAELEHLLTMPLSKILDV